MADSFAEPLRRLLSGRSIAALGTLHDGAPFVSMVPFALAEDGSAFFVHVSALAAHTRDMLADPRVSLLVVDAESPGAPPQALPRLTVVGTAAQLAADSPERSRARAFYLVRFPDAEPMFDFADFSLFAIRPTSLRWVGGFAQAQSLTPASFAAAVRSGP